MATVAKVLDKNRFEARARIFDIAALGVLAAVGFRLMVDLYKLGFSAALLITETNNVDELINRDRTFYLVFVEIAFLAFAVAWITYRLFSAGGRKVGA